MKVKTGDRILVPLTRSVTLAKTASRSDATTAEGLRLGDLYVGDDDAPVRGFLKSSNVW